MSDIEFVRYFYTVLPMYELIIFSGGFISALLYLTFIEFIKEKKDKK